MTTTHGRPITADDLLEQTVLSDVAITPDGQLAVFVAGKAYDEKDKRSLRTIMAISLDGGKPWPFSAGTAVDEMPRWSPTGATLAFLSDRPHGLPEEAHAARPQVYLLPRAGGEARRLTSLGGEVHDLAWTPDGTRLILLMTEPDAEEERRRRDERGEAVDVEEQPHYWRLWSADLNSGQVTPLTPPDLQIWEFALSDDGSQAVLITSDLPYEWSWYQARLAVMPLDGTVPARTIYSAPRQLAYARFSPDGHTVAVTSCIWSDRGYYGGDVLLIPVEGGAARNLTDGHPASIRWVEWEPDGQTLVCGGYEEGESALWRLTTAGELHTLWRAQAVIGRTEKRLARAGETIALLRADLNAPTDLWVTRLSADTATDWRQLTDMNPQAREWALGPTRVRHWHAVNGTPIQGLLALPPGYQDGGRLPLVVLVHGGPASLFPHDFSPSSWMRTLVAAGLGVLMPNPRGSVGWGAAFTMSNLGDMGGADFQDVMAGVDHVVEIGIADPERLGIGGWSYGGFMTAWAITQTSRFKAAVMGAGIADWRSFHGVSNIPTWDALFYGTAGQPADPYDLAGAYARFSPLTHIANVHTSTLILHGEKDECVPVGQGYQFLWALRDRGIPAEMTVYPRAGHGPKERAHMKDILARVVNWYTGYLVHDL